MYNYHIDTVRSARTLLNIDPVLSEINFLSWSSVPDGKWLPQIKQHRETVIRLIEAYLKGNTYAGNVMFNIKLLKYCIVFALRSTMT